MNYDRIYRELMVAARCRGTDKRKLDGYYERHHIVPRCLGGGNDEANLVLLTAREHFVAHRLLAKAHPGNNKLLFAVSAFSMGRHIRYLTSRQVALARELHSAALSASNRKAAVLGLHPMQAESARQACSLRLKSLAAEGKHPSQSPEARKAQSKMTSARNSKLAAEGLHPAQTECFRLAQSARALETANRLLTSGSHVFQSESLRAKVALLASSRLRLLSEQGLHPWQTSEHKARSAQRTAARNHALYASGLHPMQQDRNKATVSRTAKATGAIAHKCPHCGTEGKGNRMLQVHFANCKLLKQVGACCLISDKPANWLTCKVYGCSYAGKGKGALLRHVNKHHRGLA